MLYTEHMGSSEFIFIGLLVVPVLLITLLRVNAPMVFLSLCLGYVIMHFLGADARIFADMFMPQASASTAVLHLMLLLSPAVLTTIFMIRTVKGSKRLLNLLPALAVGSLTALLVVPVLSSDVSQSITKLSLWQQFVRMQDLVVGVGALISLLFLWMQRPHTSSESKGKKAKAD